MAFTRLIAPMPFILAMVACEPDQDVLIQEYPELEISSQWVDFGEVGFEEDSVRTIELRNAGDLPMGISAIYEGTGHEEAFTVRFDDGDINCPVGTSDTGASAEAKAFVDTGDTGDTGVDDTGAPDEPDETNTTGLIVLDPECRLEVELTFAPLAVGEAYGSLIVETKTETFAEEGAADTGTTLLLTDSAEPVSTGSDEPSYYADKDQTRAIIYLAGIGQRGFGRAVVEPRFVDFSSVWTGETSTQHIEVRNTGDAILNLAEPQLADGCDPAYSVTWSWGPDHQLEPELATAVEITFTPEDQVSAYCDLIVASDDPANPEIEVSLRGNAGSDPDNSPPTVAVLSPAPGYRHQSASPIELELSVFDVDQPAESLESCSIKSMILNLGATVERCTPTEKSGHVTVSLNVNEFPAGSDTLLVQVTDASEVTSYASVPIVVRADYPSSDDDGDGFGDAETGSLHDCNDQSVDVYPEAAELADGLDNDCDTLIDEGTFGADDDGDTFSEEEGDCDDNDVDTFPGAIEAADLKDNNCNGQIDEGTTLYDDDNDGYAEVDNDCDDGDAEVNPGATEICDGIDNDCNGLKDNQDGCVSLTSEPLIIGGIEMSRTACEPLETVQMSVFVYDADGQEITYSWSTELDGGEIDDVTAAGVNWTAPELERTSDGAVFPVYVVASDEDGNQVWTFDDVTVYPESRLNGVPKVTVIEVENSVGGCASAAPRGGLGLVALLAGLAAVLRRRSQL